MDHKLSFEWHQAAGRNLKEARDTVMQILIDAGKAYGPNHRICQKARRLVGEIGELRAALDSAVFTEHAEKDDRVLQRVYYG